MDNSENIFLTGFSAGTNGTNTDAATVKFDSSGVRQWVKQFDGNAGGNDEGKSVTVDHAGNVIVTGTSDADNSFLTLNNDIFTISYDANGIQQWIQFYNGTTNSNDDASEVVIDNFNNVFITGQTDNGSAGIKDYDFVTIKYTPSGSQAGILYYNGPGNASDAANTLIASNNTIYVTGGSYGIASQRDVATIKYDVTTLSAGNNFEELNKVSIYPCPATTYFYMDFSAVTETNRPLKLKISDVAGRNVLELSSVFQSFQKVDCGFLKSGIYVIEINSADSNLYRSKLLIN